MTIEERNQFIMEHLNNGVSLSDVQGLLAEAGVRMTYFELRMLAAELQIDWHKQDKAVPQEPEEKTSSDDPDLEEIPADGDEMNPAGAEEDADGEQPAAAGGQNVRIEVSKLVRPGAAISGTVVFPSGSSGEWYVDNMGRLGLNLDEGSAKPTQEDVMAFQQQLPKALGYEG